MYSSYGFSQPPPTKNTIYLGQSLHLSSRSNTNSISSVEQSAVGAIDFSPSCATQNCFRVERQEEWLGLEPQLTHCGSDRELI